MTNVFICHPRRSAIGRFGGTLASMRPDDLAAHIFKAVLAQSPELDPAAIDEVMMGSANPVSYTHLTLPTIYSV